MKPVIQFVVLIAIKIIISPQKSDFNNYSSSVSESKAKDYTKRRVLKIVAIFQRTVMGIFFSGRLPYLYM